MSADGDEGPVRLSTCLPCTWPRRSRHHQHSTYGLGDSGAGSPFIRRCLRWLPAGDQAFSQVPCLVPWRLRQHIPLSHSQVFSPSLLSHSSFHCSPTASALSLERPTFASDILRSHLNPRPRRSRRAGSAPAAARIALLRAPPATDVPWPLRSGRHQRGSRHVDAMSFLKTRSFLHCKPLF